MKLEDWEHLEVDPIAASRLGNEFIDIGGETVRSPLGRAERLLIHSMFVALVIGQILKTLIPAVFWLSLGAWGYWFHMVR